MNSALIFRILFFTLFIAAMAVRAYFRWRMRRTGESSWTVQRDAVEREGRWSILFRSVLLLALIVFFILYAVNPAWLNGTHRAVLAPLCPPIGLRLEFINPITLM